VEINKYRIVEEISVFADGSQHVEFKLQAQRGINPTEWNTLGISRTLTDARKALLFHAPQYGCALS
jgi:hypothetical protein